MTAEWFDLGQRLRAAHLAAPVDRLTHAAVPPITHPIAVRATRTRRGVTLTAATRDLPASTATDDDALALLGSCGAQIGWESPATLITDGAATLPALRTLAHRSATDGPHADTAAHLGWWADRADYPGGIAVVDLLAACRRRWITGSTPDAETEPATWRDALGITDSGPAGMLDLLGLLTRGPALPLLDALAEDDLFAYSRAQEDHTGGRDWRWPDNLGRAAVGLRGRCDAADLYATALLGDPLHRRRAVHTGHVVTGQAHPGAPGRRELLLTCDRMDARLRVGNSLTGWAGHPEDSRPHFAATVAAARVVDGALTLTLSGCSGDTPTAGDPVTVHPAPPSLWTLRKARSRYRRLYAHRTSWLTTGRTPTATRRDVPLDVLVAGAEHS